MPTLQFPFGRITKSFFAFFGKALNESSCVCLLDWPVPPRVFTKILKPIAGLLKKQDVRLIIYLDDILLMACGGNTDTSCGTDSGSVRTVGICGKLSEIPTEPSPIARVSGLYDKFCNVSNQSAQRQSKEHPKGMSERHRAPRNNSKGVSQAIGQVKCLNSSTGSHSVSENQLQM